MKTRLLALLLKTALIAALFSVRPECFAAAYGNSALSSTAVLLVNQTAGGSVVLSYYNLANPNTTLVYFQFFDKAAANQVTVGTTTPAFWVAVPALGGVVDTSFFVGYTFKLGVVVAVTTTPTGSTAPTTACPITFLTK